MRSHVRHIFMGCKISIFNYCQCLVLLPGRPHPNDFQPNDEFRRVTYSILMSCTHRILHFLCIVRVLAI